MEKVILLVCILGIGLLPFISGEKLDLLAFDFYRKFGHYVHLGDCASTSKPSADGKSTLTSNCHMKKDGSETFQASEITHETLVTVKSAQDVFTHLGWCDGESVSRLGLLYNSECVSVDIAKSISFDEKTYTRAFFGTYRRGLVLLKTPSGQDGVTSASTEGDQYYPKYITYGSKEMIMMSLTYTTEADAKSSKQIEFMSEELSDQLQTLLKSPHNLKSVKITRLSTADREFRSWMFPSPLATQAVDRVRGEARELEEVKMRVLSKLDTDPYYMNYVMWPFSGQPPAVTDRFPEKTMLWQNVTLCEIQLNHVMQMGQDVFKEKCVGVMLSSKYCKRLTRRLARVKRTVKRNVHSARARWFQLTTEEKENLSQKCHKMCLINELKMDRSVNRVLFGPVHGPAVGRSTSVQGEWLKKWNRKKDRKLRGKKRKDGRRRNKKGGKQKEKS